MSVIGQIDYDALAAALVRANAHLGGGVKDRGEPVFEKQGGEFGRSNGVTVSGVDVVDGDAGSETSNESLSGGQPGVVSDLVRKTTVFGDVVAHGGEDEVKQEKEAYYSGVVRGPRTVALREKLRAYGLVLPKRAMPELGVCTFTAGTIPDVVVGGKRKLRSLAVVGDASLTLHLAVGCYFDGKSAESIQQVRSKYTSDKALGGALHRLGLVDYVAFPPGVDSETSKPAATAMEAIIGVMTLYADPTVVAGVLKKMEII